MYYLEGIKGSEPQGKAQGEKPEEWAMPNHVDASNVFYLPGNRHPAQYADGLNAVRGMRNALILEILALGVGWAIWHFAPLLAAWWRAQ